ncbi:MAG: GNAT family N-acetyltransferase [Armatimonadetes bacterium]|nr:GNAT family N-acetyltransferase [Armatimonadota bacterium]
MSTTVEPFCREFQKEVRGLIEAYLSERWGSLDASLNPDIRDITEAYREGYFAVALEKGRVIGTGAILPESVESARVVRMTVSKERRGEGIGSKILDALCEEARRRGYRSLKVETTETWDSAISFYIRYGFRILGYWDGDCHFELGLDYI